MLHWFRPAPSPPADLRFGREWLKLLSNLPNSCFHPIILHHVKEEAREIYSFGSEPSQIPEPLCSLSLSLLRFSFLPQSGARTLSRLSAVHTHEQKENPVSRGHAVQR